MPLSADDGIVLGRREFERFAVAVAAEIRSATGVSSALTRDLSRGGVCFVIQTPMPRGTPFKISLSLVLGENTYSEPLVLSGTVIWCTPTGEGYQIGAGFNAMDRQTKDLLLVFLGFLAEGVQVSSEGGRARDREGGGREGPGDPERGIYG